MFKEEAIFQIGAAAATTADSVRLLDGPSSNAGPVRPGVQYPGSVGTVRQAVCPAPAGGATSSSSGGRGPKKIN